MAHQVHVALVCPRRLHLVAVVALVISCIVHLVAHVRAIATGCTQILHVGGRVALVLHGLLVRNLVARIRLALKVKMVEIQQSRRGFLNGGGQAVGGVEDRAGGNRGARIRIGAQVADDVLFARRAHHVQERRNHGANGAKHATHLHRVCSGAAIVVQHLEPRPPVVPGGCWTLARCVHVDGVVIADINLLPPGLLHGGCSVRGTAVLLRTRAKIIRRGGRAVDESVGLNGARGLSLF